MTTPTKPAAPASVNEAERVETITDAADDDRYTRASEWADELAGNCAAQVWCLPECAGIEMDVRLAEGFKRVLKSWLIDLARENRNTEFYQGIVREIGEMFGDAAKTSDDGSLQQDVLALKVPELVRALMAACKESA